jgi:hypothetical protein
MSFSIINQSVFDTPADAFVNTINVQGVMGAGIALEFKNRYPKMFANYKNLCYRKQIKPGDCYTYFDDDHEVYLLGLAVKDDWQHWSTLEWIEQSIKSMKLVILENDIKSVNMPLPGGKNGKRGPYGKVPGLTPPPDNEELKKLIQTVLEPFANKFNIDVKLCIPEEKKKKTLTLNELFDTYFTT